MLTSATPISLLNSELIPTLRRHSIQPQEISSDQVMVSRAQAGDHDAFSELYLKNKRRVLSICMRMVRDSTLAEDLMQETFLQAYRKIALFRGDSVFSTWLHRLAVNTVLMHLRKRVMSLVSLDHLTANIPEEHAGRGFGTRDLAQAGAVDRLAIDRAVAALAPGYRSIYLLHDVQGFDHSEIASMLNCTCGTTKSQLHKARRVLRKALSSNARSSSRRSPVRMKGPSLPLSHAPQQRESSRSKLMPALTA